MKLSDLRVAILLLLLLLLIFWAASANAQTVRADRVTLNTGPCTIRSGSGSPEGVVTGVVCDTYHQTNTPYDVWRKVSGTGTTGWIKMTTGLTFGAALTKADDTNVTLTLGGSPTTAVLNATSITAGWSGRLSLSRFATGTGATVLVGNGVSDASFSATPTLTSLTATSSLTSPQLTSTANLTINPVGDIVFNPTGNDLLPTTPYDLNIGALSNKYLTLHAAELWVETLVAQNTMATIGGRILVAPTTTLTTDMTAAQTYIIVKYNNLSVGHVIYMESSGKLEFMSVISGPFDGAGCEAGQTGNFCYGVTRNLDGSGANIWYAGDAALNTGTTGNGFIDLYSVSGVVSGTQGPTIKGNVRTGTAYNAFEPRWAIGNLNGLYGYSSATYGAAFGSPSGTWLKIDPTNGIRIGYNVSPPVVNIDASGNATFSGTVNAAAGSFTGTVTASSGTIGGWSIGSTALTSTSGSVGMASSGTYRFWSGNATPSSAAFNVTDTGALTASNANISGTLTSSSGTIGGFTITSSALTNTSLELNGAGLIRVGSTSARVVLSVIDPTYYMWAGATTGASAPFAVSLAGSIRSPGLFSTTTLGLEAAGGNIIQFITNSTNHMYIEGNGYLLPQSDNTKQVGHGAFRFNIIRGVTITAGDVGFENGWSLTESYKVGINQPGIALINAKGELVTFFGEQRTYGKPWADIDTIEYALTTPEERAQIDATPEQRVKGYEQIRIPDCVPDLKAKPPQTCLTNGKPIYKTRADAPRGPKGQRQSNTARKRK